MDDPSNRAALLDYTREKVVVVDEQRTVRYANAAAERILGYEMEAYVGSNAFDPVHPEDREVVDAAFQEVVQGDHDAECTVEYRYRAADGSWVWLESRIAELADGDLDAYVVCSHDVTDRVEAERRRRTTETRLQEIAAKTGDVLWMFSADWTECLFVNPAFEDVYGMSIESLQADPTGFLDCIHPDDVDAVTAAMRRLSAGEPADMEYRVNPNYEYKHWVWVQAEPIVEDGDVERIVGFSRDVTDRRRREQQLAVMDKLLRHNIRNDMNVVLGEAEHIADEGDPDLVERTAVIRETAEALLATAEKQRDIIELLTDPETPDAVDLTAVVSDVADRMRERYPAATIEVDLPERAPAAALDHVDLAVVELVENAIVHATDDPRLTLACRTNEETVELTVADDCPPIPEYEYRVITGDHEMDDVYHSSGLGLWLVYWLVELSDGDIAFETGTGEGNRITLSFTRASE